MSTDYHVYCHTCKEHYCLGRLFDVTEIIYGVLYNHQNHQIEICDDNGDYFDTYQYISVISSKHPDIELIKNDGDIMIVNPDDFEEMSFEKLMRFKKNGKFELKLHDIYFKNLGARNIFYLVKTDATIRTKGLNITAELYHNRIRAKEWYDEILKSIDIEKHHPDYDNAKMKLISLYERMVDY